MRILQIVRTNLPGLYAVLFVALSTVTSNGQGNNRNRVLILSPREYDRQIQNAEKAINGGEFLEAITLLDELLQGEADIQEDFFVGTLGAPLLADSIRNRAERLLLNLPAKGKEVYELQFAAEAKRLLTEAIQSRDFEKMAQVQRRFVATKAGHIASFLLGQHHLDSGRPFAAVRCFSKLVDSSMDEETQSKLLLLRSIGLFQSGDFSSAEKALGELTERFPKSSFTIDGQQHVMADLKRPDYLVWLRDIVGNEKTIRLVPAAWLNHRGDLQRNAESDGSFPLLNMQWESPVANLLENDEAIEAAIVKRKEANQSLIPVATPIVVGEVCLIRNAQRLSAVHLKSGKRIWTYPWAEPHQGEPTYLSGSVISLEKREKNASNDIFSDAIHTQLASDGTDVFFVHSAATKVADFVNEFNQIPRQFWNELPVRQRTNVLVALNLETEGKYLWRVGDLDGQDDPKLAGVFFLGAPLIVGEEVFAIAERNGDVSLYALHRSSGKVKWSQQLAHIQPGDFAVKRLLYQAGASPSYSNGILICPTTVGAVVAIDVANRSLLWGYQYLEEPNNSFSFRSRSRPVVETLVGNRWMDATVSIFGGRVLVTPPESDRLLCFDLLTGKPCWDSVVKRGSDLYVGTIHRDIAVMVADHSVRGVHLQDGEQVWKTALKANEEKCDTTGRGFRTGDHYFLPTTKAILKIHIATGKIEQVLPSQEPLHNLVAHRDKILSLGPKLLRAFYQRDRLEKVVEVKLAKNQNDPWALQQKGLLLIEDGKEREGFERLRSALAIFGKDAPESEAAKQFLVDEMLEALFANFQANLDLIPELDQLVDRESDQNRLLLAKGAGYSVLGKHLEAFNAYLDLAFVSKTRSHTELITIDSEHQLNSARLTQYGIQQSLLKSTEAERSQMRIRLAEKTQQVVHRDDLDEMLAAIHLLGGIEELDTIRVAAARRFAGTENYLRAEQVLLPAIDSADQNIAASAHLILADIYAATNYAHAAARCLSHINENWPGVLDTDQNLKKAYERLAGLESISADPTKDWPYGAVSISPRATALNERHFQDAVYVRTDDFRSYSRVGPRLTVFMDQNHIIAKDEFGTEQFRQYGQYRGYGRPYHIEAKQFGGLFVVNYGNRLSVHNLLDKTYSSRTQLWPTTKRVTSGMFSSELPRKISRSPRKWGQDLVTTFGGKYAKIGVLNSHGLVYLEGSKLTCVAPQTGEMLWVRTGVKPNARIWGDDRFVFVASRNIGNVEVYDMTSGHQLGQRACPSEDQIMGTLGKHLLVASTQRVDKQSVTSVALVDPWIQKEVWRRRCDIRLKAFVDPDGFVALVEPNGNCAIVDILTGDELVSEKIDFEPFEAKRLRRVRVISSRDQFIVGCVFAESAQSGNNLSEVEDAAYYAFDRKTRKPQWQQPIRVNGYSLPSGQPDHLPIMVFTRQPTSKQDGQGGVEVVFVDKRDGRILFTESQDLVKSGISMRGAAKSKNVLIRTPNNNVMRCDFVNSPRPPAPTAQLGLEARKKAESQLNNLLGPLFDGFGGKDSNKDADSIDDLFDEAESDEDSPLDDLFDDLFDNE